MSPVPVWPITSQVWLCIVALVSRSPVANTTQVHLLVIQLPFKSISCDIDFLCGIGYREQ